MNYIGIDPSLISTGLIVNGKIINYCRESDATNKSGLSKWFKLCEQHVDFRWVKFRQFSSYSEGEIVKLKDYDKITDMIISDIESNIDKSLPTKVGIEGYNFGASVGDLIDLVTFSTLLRKKLFDYITEDITVLSPSTLKQESCKLTYKPIDLGVKKPKLVWRNNEGIAGGNFTKREMALAIIENENINDQWSTHLRSVKEELLSNKTIKKPYEDINDSYLLYHIISS